MKDIEGFEGRYAVTRDGRVWGIKRQKFLQLSTDINGYPFTSLRHKSYKIHRFVARAFVPNPFNKPQVNHKNGIKNDNHVENLEWVTHRENKLHARLNGLTARGTRNRAAKLSEDDVFYIRRHRGLIGSLELSAKFGIARCNIYDIWNKKSWGWLTHKEIR